MNKFMDALDRIILRCRINYMRAEMENQLIANMRYQQTLAHRIYDPIFSRRKDEESNIQATEVQSRKRIATNIISECGERIGGRFKILAGRIKRRSGA